MHLFDKDLKLSTTGAMTFSTEISDNWSIHGIPNGGYLSALLAKAMLRHSGKNATPTVTVHFLSPSTPGKADIIVEKIAISKNFDRLQVSLYQGQKEKVRAIGTFADPSNNNPFTRYETPSPVLVDIDKCLAVPPMEQVTLFNQMDVRLDPACTGWMVGNFSDKSEHKGWISFKQKRPIDIPAVFLMADAFPPPVFASQGVAGWVPTIEFSVSLRHLPAGDLLKGIFRTRFITCGLLEEDGQLWDTSGELVAVSRQIAQFRNQ
jgi:acyl-CoA thioesterase